MLTIFARGLLNRLFTRIYLPGPPLYGDPLLSSVPAERRNTLIAAREDRGSRFDISLQGPRETVFLSYPAMSTPRLVATDFGGPDDSPVLLSSGKPFTIADLAAGVPALADRLGAETFYYE